MFVLLRVALFLEDVSVVCFLLARVAKKTTGKESLSLDLGILGLWHPYLSLDPGILIPISPGIIFPGLRGKQHTFSGGKWRFK